MFNSEFIARANGKYILYRQLHLVQNFFVVAGILLTGYFSMLYDSTKNATYIYDEHASNALYLTIVIFCVLLTVRYVIGRRLEQEIWNEFMYATNHSQISGYRPNIQLAGPLLTKSAVQVSSNRVMVGTYGKHKTQIADVDVQYAIKLPMNNSMPYGFRYLVLAVDLDTDVPHLFIDGRRQNRLTRKTRDLWSLSKKIDPSQKLQDLEGDFYKHFKVYATNKKQLEALSILTPDTMLALRDEGYDFDYELCDRKLYVIREPKIRSPGEMEAFFQAVTGVLNELMPQLAKQRTPYDDAKLATRQARLSRWVIWNSILAINYYVFILFGLFILGSMAGMYVLEH